MSALLHPLVLLNISDHFARQAQKQSGNRSYLGVLLGSTKNGKINVFNSFELVIKDNQLDLEYLQTRLEQNKIIYPEESLLGIYEINEKNHDEFVKSPTLEKLKLLLADSLQDIGYEHDYDLISLIFNTKASQMKHSNKKFIKLFDSKGKELIYEIETKESEKVAIDTILEQKESSNHDNNDQLNDQLEEEEFILKTLRNKTELISNFLQKQQQQKNKNEAIDDNVFEILRNVNSLISKFNNYKISDNSKEKLLNLETDLNLKLSLGLINNNLTTLEAINQDIKRYESMG